MTAFSFFWVNYPFNGHIDIQVNKLNIPISIVFHCLNNLFNIFFNDFFIYLSTQQTHFSSYIKPSFNI